MQLFEALRYEPEDRGFDFRWGHLDFSLSSSFRPPGSTQPVTEMITGDLPCGVKAAGA
jgi:hypothetical protein